MTEQLIFPEIDYDKVASVRGMDITIVTTAEDDDEGRALLRALGFPFAGMAACRRASKDEDEAMAKKALLNKQRGRAKFGVRAYTRCQRCGRQRAVFRDSCCAASVSASWRMPARFPASPRRRGEGGAHMVMTDPIADMLTRIRNANMAYKDDLDVPASSIKERLAESSPVRATSRATTSRARA